VSLVHHPLLSPNSISFSKKHETAINLVGIVAAAATGAAQVCNQTQQNLHNLDAQDS